MEDKFLINIPLGNRHHGIWIQREEEEVYRKAAQRVQMLYNTYRQRFDKNKVSDNDIMSMTCFDFALQLLGEKNRNDIEPFEQKLEELSQRIIDRLD